MIWHFLKEELFAVDEDVTVVPFEYFFICRFFLDQMFVLLTAMSVPLNDDSEQQVEFFGSQIYLLRKIVVVVLWHEQSEHVVNVEDFLRWDFFGWVEKGYKDHDKAVVVTCSRKQVHDLNQDNCGVKFQLFWCSVQRLVEYLYCRMKPVHQILGSVTLKHPNQEIPVQNFLLRFLMMQELKKFKGLGVGTCQKGRFTQLDQFQEMLSQVCDQRFGVATLLGQKDQTPDGRAEDHVALGEQRCVDFTQKGISEDFAFKLADDMLYNFECDLPDSFVDINHSQREDLFKEICDCFGQIEGLLGLFCFVIIVVKRNLLLYQNTCELNGCRTDRTEAGHS